MDPDYRSYNKSEKKLLQNNIKVKKGILLSDTKIFYKSYLKYKSKGLPYVAGKMAVSKDFFTKNIKNKWITNKFSRGRVHLMRSCHDCILTSVKTIIYDDPKLTCRILGLEKNPANLLPIIMETAIGIRSTLQVFGNDYNTKDGTGIRDYIHVMDLADAHIKTMHYILQNNKNLIVNLATGKGHSVFDLIKKSKIITKKDIDYNVTNRREGDVESVYAISNLANKKLNWNCNYSDIDTIISSMWEIYKRS